MEYSFKIIFNKPETYNPYNSTSAIYVNDICIIAKNGKEGCFYNSKYIKSIDGKFHYCAGSHQYPVLSPKNDKVVINVSDFPQNPKRLTFSNHPFKKCEYIEITDIEKTSLTNNSSV